MSEKANGAATRKDQSGGGGGIERFVGQHLYNYKWTNSKWNGSYAYGGTAAYAGQSAVVKSQRASNQEKTKRINRHSSGSSSSSSSLNDQQRNQKMDARAFVGVGLIAGRQQQQATTESTATGGAKPSTKNGKRRRNWKKSPPSSYWSSSTTGLDQQPRCYYCDTNTCSYHHDPSRREEYNEKRRSSEPASFNNYYLLMEAATYSFHHQPNSSRRGTLTPPPERPWLAVQNFDEQASAATITCLSYNVLCDKYAAPSFYTSCPSWALNWDYRKRLIMHQLRRYQPDVVTLQEVETQQYYEYFKPKLESLGYEGVFSARSRARTMGEYERRSVDGCALFWKADKFQLQREHVIEFTQLAIAKAAGSEHMLNRVMTRDNIALTAVLQFRSAIADGSDARSDDDASPESNPENLIGTPLILCSTHTHWDPEYCDVKLIQSMMLVQELTQVLERTAREYDLDSDQVPLLLCGDLNSTEDSSVYEFVTTGCVDSDHEDFKDFRGHACLRNLSANRESDYYSHELQLKSAYDMGIMPFTNYTHDFKGVIDYIFATPSLVCQNVLGPMENSWMEENDVLAFPCPHVPSDHIALVAQFGVIAPVVNPERMSGMSELSSDTQSYLTDD